MNPVQGLKMPSLTNSNIIVYDYVMNFNWTLSGFYQYFREHFIITKIMYIYVH